MSIYKSSNIMIADTSTLVLEDNVASNQGGGIYVHVKEETAADVPCWFTVRQPPVWGSIVFNNNSVRQPPVWGTIVFNNNSAATAGNDIYGGSLHKCHFIMVELDGKQ